MGAVEEEFPKTVSDNGILSSKDLEQINLEYGVKIESTVSHIEDIDREKICEIFMQAEDNLIITFPSVVNGEKRYVANIVEDLCEICLKRGETLKLKDVARSSALDNYYRFKEQAKSVEGAKQLVSKLKGISKTRSLFGKYAELLGSVEKALKNTDKIKNTQEINFEDNITIGKQLFFPNKKTSISQIETYFSCPYLHFVKYGLQVKEREDGKVKALDIGNFLHKCLERTTKIFSKIDHIDDAKFSSIMKEVLFDLVKEEKYSSKINALQLEALKKEACRLCYAVLRGIEKSGFKPIYAEARFSEDGEFPSVKLNQTDIILEGKIDRIDKCDKMVRLIDYKTGQVDLDIKNLYYGKKIQLFAYLLSIYEQDEYKPVGVFYLPIKSIFRKDSNVLDAYKLEGYFVSNMSVVLEFDHELTFEHSKSQLIDMQLSTSKENKMLGKKVLRPQPNIIDEQQLKDLAQYSKLLISGAVKEITDGNIMASPIVIKGNCACDYCKFKCICKIDENPEMRRIEKEKITIEDITGVQ